LKKKYKICLAASAGGHLQELLNIVGKSNFDTFLLTFKSKVIMSSTPSYRRVYFLADASVNFFSLIINFFQSFFIFMRERPSLVISTGAGVALPFMILSKIFLRKIIYIELSCQIAKPSKTGRVAYYLADRFYIQHEPLKLFYPNSILVKRFSND